MYQYKSIQKEQIMQQINIMYSDPLVTQIRPEGSGYTWTFASLLGGMLRITEELFGQRDHSYTILGIEIGPDIPKIWYPGNRKDIIIQLDSSAATDMYQACYQLAHETIHLLAPSGGQNANNFEEGVACYFADLYMKEVLKNPYLPPSLPSYRTAFELVKPLLDADRYCVRRLRDQQPSFSKMSGEQISTAFPSLTLKDVDFLTKRFNRNSS